MLTKQSSNLSSGSCAITFCLIRTCWPTMSHKPWRMKYAPITAKHCQTRTRRELTCPFHAPSVAEYTQYTLHTQHTLHSQHSPLTSLQFATLPLTASRYE